MTLPWSVVVAGDWHCNARWARHVIDQLPGLLPEESPRLILQLGDFGIWPGGQGLGYLRDVSDALARAQAQLWFIDGNHECHPRLEHYGRLHGGPGKVPIAERIWWLPRGYRWQWHDRVWLALGGATPVDRSNRTVGFDWFPEEAITDEQARQVMADGPADVMLTHDCPAGVPVLGMPNPPLWWDLETANQHRENLRVIVDAVQPVQLMHGHFHTRHASMVRTAWGEMRVDGFDMDGTYSNFGVLNIADMTWES